ncbi:MAG: hypothetical protein ABGX82_14630 [Pseudomonas sp.]|uniref:hypothetical protein n=1 Tax=Pseudomonas sp. TaxID=306 RepID=UPI003242F5B5
MREAHFLALCAAFFGVSGAACAEVNPGVFGDYTPEYYPKTFATWGEDGVRRIMELERAAAASVDSSPRCDEVALVGWSEQRSTPPESPVVFVDCENGERFYVSEGDISRQPISQSQLLIPKDQAIASCQNAVRGAVKFPASVVFSALGVAVWSNKTTGNTVAEMEFRAQDELGSLLPYKASCYFAPGVPRRVEIVEL